MRYKPFKIIASLTVILLALIPTWIYLLAKLILSPQGFWQGMAVFALGVITLGELQIVLLIIMVILLLAIWLFDL